MNSLEELMNLYGTEMVRNRKKENVPITDVNILETGYLKNASTDMKLRNFMKTVKPMDESWKSWCRANSWWANDPKPGSDVPAGMYELRDKILTFGGDMVCMAFDEPDLDNILKYGQLWIGYNPIRVRGRSSRCHENSLMLTFRNPNYRLCTGYALSDDGMWRQHSWCIEKRPRSIKIIETTEPRVLYFGFVLDDETRRVFRRRL